MWLYTAMFRRGTVRPLSWPEAIGALNRASAYLETTLQSAHAGRAGILVRPTAGQATAVAQAEVEGILRTDAASAALPYTVEADASAHVWVLLRGQSLQALVEGAQAAGAALLKRGLAERVVAAVFPFTWRDKRLYWVYQQRLRKFTPFVPTGRAEDKSRDFALEVRMERVTRGHLPTESKTSAWYPLWDLPL